jgi:hypothetical protein
MDKNKTTKAATKPEIWYDRETGRFTDKGEWITDDHMWSLWNEVGSADWTQGAFNKAIELLQKGANRHC